MCFGWMGNGYKSIWIKLVFLFSLELNLSKVVLKILHKLYITQTKNRSILNFKSHFSTNLPKNRSGIYFLLLFIELIYNRIIQINIDFVFLYIKRVDFISNDQVCYKKQHLICLLNSSVNSCFLEYVIIYYDKNTLFLE